MTPNEIEFLSEEEEVKIIPKFKMEKLQMIGQTFGPFRAQIPISVPLWVAISLRKDDLCRIRPPYWLDLAWLRKKFEEEKEDDHYFTQLPFHYMEIASQLLSIARDDIPEFDSIRSVLGDLEAVRFAKLRKGFQNINGSQLAFQLENLSAMELNRVRPFFTASIDRLKKAADLEKKLPAEI